MARLPSVVPFLVLAALTGGCGRRSAADTEAQAPPPGIRYEAHVQAGGVAPPALPLTSARGNNATDAAAGGNLFASMNCDGCHGGGGTGWAGPSLIDGRWRYGGADDELFSTIYFGRPKGMPAYGGVIGPDGVWMLVAYLKAQPVPSVVPTTSYEEMDRTPSAPPAPASPQPEAISGGTPEQMLVQYGCIACHAVDRKAVGPSLTEIAAKYKGQPGAESRLADKVRTGGGGVWGTVNMVPNPQVPDQDLQALVKWVLSR